MDVGESRMEKHREIRTLEGDPEVLSKHPGRSDALKIKLSNQVTFLKFVVKQMIVSPIIP